jgi:hypothetical protein
VGLFDTDKFSLKMATLFAICRRKKGPYYSNFVRPLPNDALYIVLCDECHILGLREKTGDIR